MILIGINGQSGAGKTTLANNLFNDLNCKVIHLDHIFDEIKSLLPETMVLNITRNDGEVIHCLSNSYGKNLKLYPLLRKNIAKILLSRIINNALKDNYDYLIIEGTLLEEYCNLNDFDYTIFISALPEIRYRRVVERNSLIELSLTKNTAQLDLTVNPDLYSIHIENNGSLDWLISSIKTIEQTITTNNFIRNKN